MKSYKLTIAIFLISALSIGNAQSYFPAYSSYAKTDLNIVEQRYLISLSSDNEGIVTSALAQIGRMKMYFPEEKFSSLETKITELSLSGETSNIRYRAFLLCNLFSNPTVFTNESRARYEDSEELFTALASKLNATLIGSNQSR